MIAQSRKAAKPQSKKNAREEAGAPQVGAHGKAGEEIAKTDKREDMAERRICAVSPKRSAIGKLRVARRISKVSACAFCQTKSVR